MRHPDRHHAVGALLWLACAAAFAQSATSAPMYFGRFPTWPISLPTSYDLHATAIAVANSNNRLPITEPVVTPIGNGDYSSVFQYVSSAYGGYPCGQCQVFTASDIIGVDAFSIINIFRTGDTPKSCPSGNPIYPLMGTKREVVDLGIRIGGLNLRLTYDSTQGLPQSPGAVPSPDPRPPVLGPMWSSTLHRRLSVQGSAKGVLASRGDGHTKTFSGNGNGTYTPEADTNDRLLSIIGGYRYIDATERSEETYNSQGSLTAIASANGDSLNLTYSDATTPNSVAPSPGYLIQATDNRGRIVKFEYQLPQGADPATGGRIYRIVDPDQKSTLLGYDGPGNVASVTWSDTSVRQFLYELPGMPWALTGVIDERTVRFSTFAYDSAGRARSTEHAGGVDRFSVTYSVPPGIRITEVLDAPARIIYRYHDWIVPQGTALINSQGAAIGMSAYSLSGKTYPAGQSQPAGSGCAASSSAQTYDANGNLASVDDFNQHRTCYAYDLNRNLESTRVEGLDAGAKCSTYTGANAVLPSGSRKVSTAWHPDWRLPVKVAEPGKLTTYIYNGQGASCATGAPPLPDGKAIAVLCSKTEQSTTDVNGSQGLTPTLESGVANRVWSYTYNADGQVLTVNGPRTDATDTTTYEYYPADPNAVGHTKGDLKKVTNALGKVTQYTEYDKAGRVLTMIDPNQVTTTMTYWPRGWLKTTSVGGQTTQYDYWPTGLLKRVTQPDNMSYVDYSYDDAHRLRYVIDDLGNRIDYTLDNAGNRKEEKVSDPSDALSRQLLRNIDALGRVEQTTGRE